MRTMIYDTSGTEMVTGVVSFLKSLDQVKITTRLYDGTFQVQTVGSPASFADIDVHATIAQKDDLNNVEATGAVLQCIKEGINYIGYIKEAIKWSSVVDDKLYEGTLTLLINEVVT